MKSFRFLVRIKCGDEWCKPVKMFNLEGKEPKFLTKQLAHEAAEKAYPEVSENDIKVKRTTVVVKGQ